MRTYELIRSQKHPYGKKSRVQSIRRPPPERRHSSGDGGTDMVMRRVKMRKCVEAYASSLLTTEEKIQECRLASSSV
jgi:hypothetical protein